VILTGQVGVAGHLTIGDHVIATSDRRAERRPAHTTVSGSPPSSQSFG